MALLAFARLLVAFVPLRLWRARLGGEFPAGAEAMRRATRLAAHVERAAGRLPFATKCLPRAMALSWMLRRRRIPHALVLAVRPPALRCGDDALHAWVEHRGAVILGELPGEWHAVLRAGDCTFA